MTLRPYQLEIHDAAIDFLCEKTGNGIICSPGGTGKTLTMNAIIRTLVTQWPGSRIMSLVHDATVIDQNVNSMLRYWDKAPLGVYSAGLKQRDTLQPILYAGIQSVAKRFAEFGFVNLLIVDECDMVSPKDNALYQKFLTGLRLVNPKLRVIGLTATPFRLGIGHLTEMDMWDEVIIDFTQGEKFMWFVENGFLSPLVNKKAAKEIDITNISMRMGDFDEKEMQAAADTDELNKAVVDEMVRYGSDRNHWLLFAAGIQHGTKLTKLLNARGVPSIMLTGADSRDERDAAESAFRRGEYRCLVTFGLYGRGYDFPKLDLIGVARATQSTAWWLQAIKRGTRVAEGKRDCVVLDFASNTRRLGPVNFPIIPAPRRKGGGMAGDAPVKICGVCQSYVPIQTRICPDCQTEFVIKPTIQKFATSDEIMVKVKETSLPQIEDFRVLGIKYQACTSKKQTYYMRVTYSVGTSRFSEYLFFDSSNLFIRKKLHLWWTHRGGLLPLPCSVDEAVERAASELAIPSIIRVDVANKYPEVIGADFDPDAVLSDELEDDYVPY